eukprot:Rmarinus@m.30132
MSTCRYAWTSAGGKPSQFILEMTKKKKRIAKNSTGRMSTREPQLNFTFFWTVKDFQSQWYPAKFTVDGQTYSCAEQYMMHQKALLMGDEKIARKVMCADNPKLMKALGRQVSPWDEELWQQECRNIVRRGSLEKYSQNPKLKNKLYRTRGTTLVEASPFDKVWGIGLRRDDPRALHRMQWRGKNLLGYILTEVRDELMRRDGLDPKDAACNLDLSGTEDDIAEDS